ncbi:hypothetical protein [Streptomyces griseiscabiei]|uniref:Uncharacterized protein n=1 Tax=Streptomyces griseiscabiei TaxID=2993540 RepID=A0ABU4LD75_9ACTN|nr:hypothetical protein [Streptomyces griseiscabiei]MBZ3900265.1 hypothetical protein [Streptomyces griseiscabiei]MDX2913275.1 hypothetical protein [Streptomyces griseiscabiei]
MPETVEWLVDWHATQEQELRSRGITATVKQPAPGTAGRGRPKATAVCLTLESDERLGKLFVWESGSASLLFIDCRTEYTWQDEQVISSENDLPRILAPIMKLVEGSVDQG